SYMSENNEQPLPSTFEEFNEQRKAAFIRVKDYKQAGNRLVGFLCSYTPLEIIDAAGAASVALCGTSDEVIPEAEKVLPANLCPLIKSTYGFAYSQKCPFTYFSDMIIGETTCDGKKKMYELLNELKRTHILHLPQGRDRAYEREGWYEECRLLKEELETSTALRLPMTTCAPPSSSQPLACGPARDVCAAGQPAGGHERRRPDEHHVRRYVQL
ncbi:MAG: 2-hydroxyacyl-CoA dehydratase, partial [Collinsella sp.]